ncbi:GWT1-domain-containing protein [Coprinellus micaceus]|uniref:GPI-anchored wall transfer protein n=1 Tax=Coprinellus micaceus TaxID=71717 RepID=A0A4Y7TEZ3_COPMI|nr:GWT1-domain-containing protein [Coprinellus micaceus]
MDNYKHEKEAFVSGMTGSSVWHINLVSLAALASVALHAAVQTRFLKTRRLSLLTSWAVLVLPLLLSMTLFATRPLLLSLLLMAPTCYLLTMPKKEGPSPLPSKQPPSPGGSLRVKLPPLPALSTYRAHMMLMTILAILAVDFPVFPRSLAKCETFGVSMMDLGVGSFVFSQGVVSALPLIRDQNYLTAPLLSKLIRVTKKCLPIIALGMARVVLVKGAEYPEHVTEYGVHWNFFLTLAFLPILQVLLHPIIIYLPISLIGILVAVAQQTVLSRYGLKEYVLNAPRTSLVGANKEGIVSLTGYLAIHLLGLSAGTIILPPTPSFFRRRQQAIASRKAPSQDLDPRAPRQLGKTATELCSYAILWWTLLGVSKLAKVDREWGPDGGVSRRMANLPYVFWVAAYNISFTLAYILILDLFFFPGPKPRKIPGHLKSPTVDYGQGHFQQAPAEVEGNPPELLEAINKHGLALFLVANVLTGLINLSMKTMYMSDAASMIVLSAYSMVVSAVAWFWNRFDNSKKQR